MNSRITILLRIFPIILSFTNLSLLANLEPSALMKHETKWLVRALEQAHYNKVSIDDLNASIFLRSYLKKLDPQKYISLNRR